MDSQNPNNLPIDPANGEKWLSLAEAALHTPYSAEYLSLLARRGKLTAKKIDNTWYTTQTLLDEYMRKQMLREQVQKGQLPVAPSQIAVVARAPVAVTAPSLVPETSSAHEEIVAKLKTIRSYHDDHREYFAREEKAKTVVEQPSASATQVHSASHFAPHLSQIEHALERVIEKKFSFAHGTRLSRLTSGLPNASGLSKSVLALSVVAVIFFTVMPVPFVFSFFEKSFDKVSTALNDARTVMGFRPGTSANELLLLDKNGNISIMGHIESRVENGTAPFVVDSVTLVNNLNADYLDGLHAADFTLAYVTKNGAVTTEDVKLDGKVEVGKTLTVSGLSELGDVKVLGDAEFTQILRVLGPAFFEGIVTVRNDLNTTGNFTVGKNITVSGSVDVGRSVTGETASFERAAIEEFFSAAVAEITELISDDISADALTATNSTTTNAVIESLTATTSVLATLTFTDASGVNSTTTNATTTNLFASVFNVGSITATGDTSLQDFTFVNATGTSATTTNLFSTNATFTNLISSAQTITELLFTNATGTNATTTNFFATTASSTNLFFTTGNGGNFTSTGLGTFANLFALGSTTLNTFVFNTATGTAATTTNLFSTTASSTNLFSTSANIGTLTLGSGTFSNLFLTGSTTLQNFTFVNATGTNATTTNFFSTNGVFTNLTLTSSTTLENFVFQNATGTSATTTNFFSTTASSTNLFFTTGRGGNFTSTGLGTFTNLLLNGSTTLQNLTFVNATGTSATTTNFFSTTASSTNAFATTLRAGNITSTGLGTFANLLLSGSTTLQNFTFVNATGTSATTTNLFSTTASSTNLFFTTGRGGNLTSTGLGTFANLLLNGSSTLQNLTFVNATGTNATTTNLFSTTASSTNLFSAFGTLGNLLVTGSSTLQNFTGRNATTTNATSTNFFATTASSTNLFGAFGTFGNILATGSSTLKNFTFINATGTSATTTNSFATTASSTNLFSTNANIGNALLGNSTTTQLAVSSLTLGSIPFATTGGRIIDNNSQLFWDNSQTYLGLGINTPSEKFHVSGGVALFNAASIGVGAGLTSGLRIAAPIGSSHYNWMIGAQQNVAGGFEITPSTATGGTTFSTPSFVVKADTGYVGIGTIAPDYQLSVDSASADSSIRVNGANGFDAYLRLTEESGSDYGGMLKYQGTDNYLAIGTLDNGTEVPAIYIPRNSTSVGIGTTSPSDKLSVYNASDATINIDSQSGASWLEFSSDSTNRWSIGISENSSQDIDDFSIFEGASSANPRLTVADGGSVGIGTTSPDSLLHLFKSSGDAILSIENTGNGNSSGIDFIRERSSGASVAGGSIFLDSNTSTNQSTLYLQAQSATASTGFTSALTDNNGARIMIGGDDSKIVFESGSTETMRIMDNMVGIGTTTPSQKLEVNGTIASANTNGFGQMRLIDWDGTSYRTTLNNDGTLHFQSSSDAFNSGATSIMAFSGGNVGIGTTSPDALLHLETADNTTTLSLGTSDASTIAGDILGEIEFYAGDTRYNGVYTPTASIRAVAPQTIASAETAEAELQFWTSPNDTAQVQRMVINADGNVGIGTTSPWGKLSVTNTGSGPSFIVEDTTSSDSSPFIIDATGAVGIGTTSPQGKLHVSGTYGSQLLVGDPGAAGTVSFRRGSDGAATGVVGWAAASESSEFTFSNTSGGGYFTWDTNPSGSAVEQMRLTNAGSLGIGTTTPNQKLSIFADGADAAIEFSTVSGANEKWTIGIDDSDASKFKIASSSALGTTDRLTIDGNGYFGINDSAPDTRLEIIDTSTQLRLTHTDAVDDVTFAVDTNGDMTINLNATAAGAGNLLFGDSDTFAFGGVAAGLGYHAISDSGGATSHGLASDDDLFVEGDIELNGTLWADGAATFASTITVADDASFTGGRISIDGTDHSVTSGENAIWESGGSLNLSTRSNLQVLLDNDSTQTDTYFSIGTNGAATGLFKVQEDGNVGVGTTSPWGKLSVTNTGSGPSFVVEDSSSPDSTPFVIDASGSVGIGLASPSQALEVNGNIVSRSAYQIDDGTNGDFSVLARYGTYSFGYNAYLQSGNELIVASGEGASNLTSTNHAPGTTETLQLGSDTDIKFWTDVQNMSASASSTPRAVITNTGLFGIGTTLPAELLHLSSTTGAIGMEIESGTNVDAYLRLGEQGTSGFEFLYDGTNNRLEIGGGTSASYSPHLTILRDTGLVGIGTTTPDHQLVVSSGTSGDSVAVIEADTDNSNEDDNPRLLLRQDGNLVNGLIGLAGATSPYTGFLTNALFFEAQEASGNDIQFVTGATSIGGTNGVARLTIESGGDIGIGATDPATILDIDTASNSDGLRLRGLAETTEIADIFVGADGELILTTRNTGGSTAFVEVDAEDNDYGLIIRDSNTGTSDFANLYMNTATVDYLNIVVGATNSTIGLVVDENEEVGIGTTTPAYKLHVTENGDSTDDAFAVDPANGGNRTLTVSGDTINVSLTNNGTAGSLVLQDNGGSVGIGTTSPSSLLHVSGSSFTPLTLERSGDNDVGVLFTNSVGDASDIYMNEDESLVFRPNASEAMRITSAGNVGIGTTSPMYGLSVVSNTSGNIAIFDSGQSVGQIRVAATPGTAFMGVSTGGTSYFGSNSGLSTSNISVTSGGSVGIGTTTPHSSGKLEVNGEIIAGALRADGGQIRMINGNYGAFFRNDGTNTYLLLTASGDAYGTWNSLRPFTVNDSTGAVSINTVGSGATIVGNTSSALTINSSTVTLNSNNIGISSAGAITGATGITTTGTLDAVLGDFSSTLTMSGTAANIALGSNYLSGDGGDEGVFVDSAGNVGIGTTTPAYKLDVFGTLGVDDNIAVNPYGALTDDNYVNFTGTRAYVGYEGGNAMLHLQGGSGKGIVFAVNDGTFGNGEVARITSTGNFGLGDTSADTKLEIVDTTAQLRLTHTDGVDDATFAVDTNGDLTLNVNATTGAGNLLLGDADTLAIGGVAAGLVYNAIADSGGATSHSLDSDDDLFVEGAIELDGSFWADGAATIAGAATITGAASFEGGIDVTAGGIVSDARIKIEGTGAACSGEDDGTAGIWFADAGDCSTAFFGISNVTDGSETFQVYLGGAEVIFSRANFYPGTDLGQDIGGTNNRFADLYLGGANIDTDIATSWALADVANSLSFDTDTLSIDALNERIGIGTTTPVYKLEVRGGDFMFEGGDLIFADAGGTTNNLEYVTTNDGGLTGINTSAVFSFHGDVALGGTAADPSAGISVDGIYSEDKVGIGTTTPNQMLSIFQNGADAAIEFSTVSGANETWTIGVDDSDASKFKIASSSALGSSDRLTIDGNGNVGIGDSSPDEKLQVAGDVHIDTSGSTIAGADIANASLLIGNGTLGIGIDTNEIYSEGADLNIGTIGAFDISLVSGGGQVELSDGDTLNAGGVADLAYNAIADSGGATSHGLASDDDLFVEGDLETNGTFWADGTSTFAGDLTLATGVQLDFQDEVADKIYLYSTNYGIGVSASETNWWSGGVWSWRTTSRTGTEVMNLSAGGNLQIDGTLDVDGATTNIGVVDTTGGTLTLRGNTTGSTEGGEIVLDFAADHDGTTNSFNIDVNGDDLRFFNGSTVRMRIDGALGYVGVSEDTPNTLFHVGSSTPGSITAANNYRSAFISGDLEVDGAFWADGAATLGSTLAVTSTITEAGSAVLSAADIDTCAEFIALVAAFDTGTCGNLVFSASPTLTGTLTAAAATLSGTLTANGTLDANGIVTLGDNGDTIALDSSDWDISTTGAMTGIGAITADGNLTLSGTAANIILGSNYLSGDGGDEGVFVTSTGAVGIGTTTPNTKLTVTGDGTLAGSSQMNISGTTDPRMQLVFGYDTTDNYGHISAVQQNVAFKALALNPNGGNVGIGTTTPAEKLTVTGNVLVTSSNDFLREAPTQTDTGTASVSVWYNSASLSCTNASTGSTRTVFTTVESASVGDFLLNNTEGSSARITSVDPASSVGETASFWSDSGCTSPTTATVLDHTSLTGNSSGDSITIRSASTLVQDVGTKINPWSNVYTSNIFAHTGSFSSYDLAENYETEDDSIKAGDVVASASNGSGIVKATSETSAKVIGIVSTQPGITLGAPGERERPVALAGRVPVKYTLENGPIKAGDYLAVSSTTPGKASKAVKSGIVIGQALEDGKGDGTVLVFVGRHYYEPSGVDLAVLSQTVDTKSATLETLTASTTVSLASLTEALQTQGTRIDGLQADLVFLTETASSTELRLAALESLIASTTAFSASSTVSTSTPGFIASVLESLKASVVDGVTHFVQLAVESLSTYALTVGESSRPSGITIYDEDTGEPYCMKIKGGQQVSTPGKCGSQPQPVAVSTGSNSDSGSDSSDSSTESPTASSTPVVTEEPEEETASTTPAVETPAEEPTEDEPVATENPAPAAEESVPAETQEESEPESETETPADSTSSTDSEQASSPQAEPEPVPESEAPASSESDTIAATE